MAARRTTGDKRQEMIRGGGVDGTASRQKRDGGSNKEGKDGKGKGDTMAMAEMDGAMVTAMYGNDGNDGDGWCDGNATATEGAIATQRQ